MDKPNTTVDLRRYIDTRHFGDRPHIRGRRIPVWVVAHAQMDNQGYGVRELMYAYDLSEAEVLAALLYYETHKDEIEAQEEAVRSAV
ncbi:MAG: hypothetical protein OHK0046_14320 [Anaerolineae bacterium]